MQKIVQYYIPLLFVGFLMGPFSSLLFISVLHLPIVAPELIFIPFFFFFYNKFGIKIDKKLSFSGIILLWLIFLFLAIIWGTWSFLAVSSTGRSFLIMGIFYVIGKGIRFDDALARVMLVCSIGSIMGWGIKSYFNFIMLANIGAYEESVVYGNMIAIAYAFAISILMKSHYLTIMLVFAINVFLSFSSSLRRQISVSVLSLCLSLSMMTIRNKKVSYLVLVLLLSVPVYYALPQIEGIIQESNTTMYYRIFERSQSLLEGDLGNSEKSRVSNQFKIFDDFTDLILPHGYVSQQTASDKGTGIFNDVPLYMLAYTFGVLLLFIYIIFYLCRLYVIFIRFIKYDNPYYGVVFVVGAVMLFLHFVDSTMFTVSYTAPFTGITLGLIFRNTLLIGSNKYRL